MKKIFKNLISINLIILIVLGGLVFYKKPAKAENATEIIGKELAVLAGAYMATPAVCKGYAETIELGFNAVQSAKNFLMDNGGQKIKDKIVSWFGNEKGLIKNSIPVSDINVVDQGKQSRIYEREQDCTEFLRTVVLENYKKRLLDQLVNQTIKWIQGEGEPNFVQNPSQLIENARNRAIGDVILETKYSDLCYNDLPFKINLSLTNTQFSERVSCTLDDVVDNLNSFKENFRNGGWIAYQESLRLENNPAGINFLVQQEVFDRINEKENEAEYEANVGDGFLSQKECLRWEYKPNNELYIEPLGCEYNENGVIFCDSSLENYAWKRKSPDGKTYTGKKDQPGSSVYRCVESKIITPGSIAANSITKALDTEYDFLINADDLSTYGAAIIDAAINRVAKIGAEGLAYATTSSERKDCSQIQDPWLKELCERNQGSPTKQNEPDTTNTKDELESATTTLAVAKDTWMSVASINDSIKMLAQKLIFCKNDKNESIMEVRQILTQADERKNIIDSKIEKISYYENKLNNIKEEVNNNDISDESLLLLDELSVEIIDLLEEAINNEEEIQIIKTNINEDLNICLLKKD
jgi:hypothetical protein